MSTKNSHNKGLSRKQIIITLWQALKDAGIASIEFEGPEIAVYVNNPKYILENERVVADLAKTIRKRIVVRAKNRKSREETIKFIMEVIPREAGVSPSDIEFDDVLGEVKVLVAHPEKIGVNLRKLQNLILAETGWRIHIIKKPLLTSRILASVIRHYLEKSSERRKALRSIGERVFRDMVVGTRYVRVIGLGSFGEVGRSAILVDTGESKILLDAGASPTGLGPEAFPYFYTSEFRIEDLDAVVITHAHLDHIGMLPLLFKYGYRGPVYMTEPTRDIAILVLQDYIELARREGRDPPYTLKDIETMLNYTITVPYNTVTDVAPDTKLTFSNAGHILGSAVAHLHIGQGLFNILYTGDIKYYRMKGDKGTRLLPTAAYQFHRVEALIIESTYGAVDTQSREEAEKELIEMVNKVHKRGGKLLIPVMAVGRGQEILAVLNRAYKEGRIPPINIYVDGMVYEVTAIYTAYINLLAKPIREAIERGENPFISDITIYVNDVAKREEAINTPEPAIILATSGMMQGGPIIEYFKALAEDPKNALAFVSYQAPGTLGRRLVEGEREIIFEENGHLRPVRVKLEVKRIEGFTGHATRSELLMYLRHLKPKPRTIIFNHGEYNALTSLALTVKRQWERLGFKSPPEILIPENLEAIRLYPRYYKKNLSLTYSG
ncbi:MAG: beta-CASP ribonuclease aCPSF1 [Desulfurococcales archaeon]|nr:beta-CASP ribonuclease aCPSF1 [Desulfurococcales archaeon]